MNTTSSFSCPIRNTPEKLIIKSKQIIYNAVYCFIGMYNFHVISLLYSY